MHHTYNYNHNQHVLRVFLFIYVFNNFVKSYGYCRINCLEILVLKVALVSILVFMYNLLVWSHYCNFIKEFYNLFYLSKLVENDTKGRYILCFKTCDQIEIKNQTVSFFCKIQYISQCGDIETNPVRRFSSLPFCHWNLNGLTDHDSIKTRYFKHISHSTMMT